MRQLSQQLFRSLLLGALLGMGLGATAAQAQQPAAPARRAITVPAEPLAKALDALGEQTGVLIMYTPGLVAGLQSTAVSGDMTPAVALRQMLQGSGLGFSAPDANTFVLRKAPAADETTTGSSSSPAQGKPRQLPGVLVVGSRLGASQYESAQPVILISREDIERSGASTIADVLAQRPEVSVNNVGDNGGTSGNYNATTVQLRGMPRGTTLVLVNGRRIGDTGAQSTLDFFDLSTLPLALVDHIEILPVGSSAVYGGDALAGVVNIVLKKNAQGLDINLRRSFAKGYMENEIDLTWGKSWSRGSLTVSGSYKENSGLYESERALTANKDYTRFGGTDNRSYVTNPGNVFSLEGCPPAPASCFVVPRDQRGNLPGLDAPYAAVPVGSTGENLTPADFAATAGTLNRASALYPIFLPAERYGVMVNGRFDLTSSTELFTELTFSRNRIHRTGTEVSLNGEYGSYRVPASNPYNPFGEEVAIDFLIPGRPESTLDSDYLRALFGARGSLGDWDWEVAEWQSRNTADQVNFFDTRQLIRDALASSDPATALNPFQDGPGGSPELIASFFNSQVTPYTTKLLGANGFIRGPLAQLPGGPLKFLFGGEYERQEMLHTSTFGGHTSGRRNKHAVFTEMRAPLLPGNGDDDAAAMLTLTGALRADRDSSFAGTGVTKTFGIEYRPWPTLLIRGTWNTAFKPPILYQASQASNEFQTTVNDPRHGGAATQVVVRYGGVPESIRPERGTSTTLGAVYSPDAVPLNFTMTWWRNRIRDRILAVGAPYLVQHEDDFPGRVIRDSSGVITLVDNRAANVNFINNSGVDFGLSGHWNTDYGTFFPAVVATWTYEYETQVRPTIPVVDGVGKAAAAGFAPRWKGLLRMGWQRGNLYAQLSGRYISHYRDYYPLPANTPRAGDYLQLGDFWLFDVSLNYAVGKAWAPDSKWFSGTTFSLSALNLFDREPDFSNAFGNGYDPAEYDIRGRYVTANLKFSF